MKKITLKDRLHYHFDNTMSRGTAALILWLFVLSVLLIVAVTLVVALAGIGPEGKSFLDIAWMGLMRALDSGTISGDEGSWFFLLMMFIVTLGGVFIVSTLIGVLTSGIEEKLSNLRKGRSFVAEQRHTIILGWSSQIFTVISELVIANANQKRSCIVILAEKDMIEMTDEIADKVPDTGSTRVVCRSGNPMDLVDLEIVNPHAARSIIILAPEGVIEPDIHVIKTILAITNNPKRKTDAYHIVASIAESKNLDVARMVGKDEVSLVLTGDLIARISAQTCRQSGLSIVYGEFLDFGGDEIYFKEEPELIGTTFGDALFAYEKSAVLGLALSNGKIVLNPPMDSSINRGDRIIAVSEDDDTIVLSRAGTPAIDSDAIRNTDPSFLKSEKTLIIGWNKKAVIIIRELDAYIPSGSHISIFTNPDNVDVDEIKKQLANLGLKNSTIAIRIGDTTDRKLLDRLDLFTFNHIIVLGYSDTKTAEDADAHTLVTLLHLRDIEEKAGKHLNIVSEMLDMRNRDLAEVTQADDFIVSNRLVSLILAQISENKSLGSVFEDLFDPTGCEIYIKPVEHYVQTGRPITFYTVMESARRKGQIALGYRITSLSHNADSGYGVTINPVKSDRITFSPDDRIILLSED